MEPLEFAHGTDIGLHRSINEDAFAVHPELGLWLVADGMGGHDAGEIASALARDTVVASMRGGRDLVTAITHAHAAVIAHSSRAGQSLEMGTTMVAFHRAAASFQISWIGDSRAYLFDGRLSRLTRDHSYVEALLQQGAISEAEMRAHPNRNVITHAIGITTSGSLHIDTVTGALKPGTLFLLCSDGLTEAVTDADIADILARNASAPQACVDQLITAALAGGGSDNITVIVLRCGA